MVRKGLLKRVLPAVLSAAMIFTSVPANAFAAETAPAIEAEADEITDLTEEAPAEAPAEEASVEAEEPAATGEENEDAYEDLATFQPTILVDLAKVKARINFEITETASEYLADAVLRTMSDISDNGNGFSLDDYGSGYSNLSRV
ncbi:MAG: hypothetical protein K6C95_10875, partial [Lachnospiraceae bacterium]|nr:hypothetical protein [Lachnospiraceae bacterium]